MGSVFGLAESDSSPMPAPMAPLVTSVTETPLFMMTAIWPARSDIVWWSGRPASSQMALVPTLTTTRPALAMMFCLIDVDGIAVIHYVLRRFRAAKVLRTCN